MRAITQAADTSLSAANYHFGSKQALIEAALVRRIEPLNNRRLEAIDALEESSEGVDSRRGPARQPSCDPDSRLQRESSEAEGRRLREVAARFSADPHAIVSKLKFELFAPVIGRYLDALQRALPDRTREELALDFQFFLGVMVHVMSGKNVFVPERRGLPRRMPMKRFSTGWFPSRPPGSALAGCHESQNPSREAGREPLESRC